MILMNKHWNQTYPSLFFIFVAVLQQKNKYWLKVRFIFSHFNCTYSLVFFLSFLFFLTFQIPKLLVHMYMAKKKVNANLGLTCIKIFFLSLFFFLVYLIPNIVIGKSIDQFV